MSGDDRWDPGEDDEAEAPGDLTPVPGVYNYCDAWCERCVFQLRCAVFRDRVLMEADLNMRTESGAAAVASSAAAEVNTPTARCGDLTAVSNSLDEADVNADADYELWEARRRAREADPLYLQARHYADLTSALMESLRPEIEATGDAVLASALDVIHWHTYAIQVKVRRALGGLFDPFFENDDDPVQTDYNGTAKLVRLMIAESRAAWNVLVQGPGPAPPGRITCMLDRLAILDAGLARRFPRAMEFVRPGFDE
jgi:hypothetical protein